MSKKHTEFVRSHGASDIKSNLPVPRSDRFDADQGLSLRLAQSSLDSGRAYPQRHGRHSKERRAEHGSYGGGSDSRPVGDVGCPRPNSSSNSYYARQQVYPPPPHCTSPHDRPAPPPNGYEPAVGPDSWGAVPGGMPPYGGPMAPPEYFGGPGFPPAGPGYGPRHPPQHAYGPAPGAYSMQPYGPAGPYAAGAPPGGPGPMGGASPPPHMLEHGPMPAGFPYGVPPPPPPPPRRLPPQHTAAHMPAGASMAGAGPEGARLAATAHVEPSMPPSPAAAGPAGAYAAAPAVQPSGSGGAAIAAVVAQKPTPFAASEPEPQPAAEAPAAPRNEFAERLAERAMASAARAKSSLLAGAGSSALSSVDSLSRRSSLAAGKPPARGVSVDVPSAAYGFDSSSSNSPTDPSGVFVKPSHPFGRPKLAVKPRSALQDATCSGNYSSTSSDSGDAPIDHGSAAGSAASSFSSRPRLNLLPRGSSGLADGAGTAAATAAGGSGARKASVFGDAKPREEVLKQRGLDPALVDARVEMRAGMPPAAACQGSAGADDDDWHTVSGHGRKGSSAAQREVRGLPDAGGLDPFFGGVRPSYFKGGRHSGRAAGMGYGDADGGDDDDDVVFRRALPTRQVPLALI